MERKAEIYSSTSVSSTTFRAAERREQEGPFHAARYSACLLVLLCTAFCSVLHAAEPAKAEDPPRPAQSGDAPEISAEGVVNAASFLFGPVAPGEIASVFGAALGPEEGVGAELDQDGKVSAERAGVRVLFDSVAAPLFFVREDQINLQVPYEVADKDEVGIRVVVDGVESEVLLIPVAASAPGLFRLEAGEPAVVAVLANGSIVTPANPANPGDVVTLYGTGEGRTQPPGVTGMLAEEPLPVPILPVEVTIGGAVAEILYAGAAPGFAGLLQINAVVPESVSAALSPEGLEKSGSNEIPITLRIGDAPSQPGATIAIDQAGVNNPPSAVDDAATTERDAGVVIDVLANDSDVDGDTLTIESIGQPAQGAAAAANGAILYTPAAGFVGSDEFEYTISDGRGGTATATVRVTVTRPDEEENQEPVPVNVSVSVETGKSRRIRLQALDDDGDVLSITVLTPPARGSVGAPEPERPGVVRVLYTAPSGFEGPDSFTFLVEDGAGGSAVGTVLINVFVPVPDTRTTGVNDTASTPEDTPIEIDVLGNDTIADDAGPLTLVSVQQPANGSAQIVANRVRYTPNPDFNGLDVFGYNFIDSDAGGGSATIRVTVTPVNDPPVAVDDSTSTPGDSAVVVDVLANDSDVDQDSLTVSAVTQGGFGTVVNNGATVTYTPNGTYAGLDSFTYTASDGNGGFDTATVTVDVLNQPPVANAGADQAVVTGQTANFNGGGSSDPDNFPNASLAFSWTVLTAPAGSTASVQNAATATPSFTPDRAGIYTIQLTVNDGAANATDTVQVTVTKADTTTTITSDDPDQSTPGQPVTVAVAVAANLPGSGDPGGSVQVTGFGASCSAPLTAGAGSCQITPTTTGPGSFQADYPGDANYNASSDTEAHTVNELPIADAGADQNVVTGQTASLNGGGSSDPDNQPNASLTFSWTLLSAPASSTASLQNPDTATPSLTPDLAGTYVVQLIVNDGCCDSLPDTVTIEAEDEADLSIVKTGPATVVAGGVLVYAVQVTNNSPRPAPDHTVTDTVPAGTSFNAGQSDAACSESAGVVTCTFGAIPASSSAPSFAIAFNVGASASGTIDNTASVSTTATDPTPGNDSSAAATVTITQEADLEITKTDGVSGTVAQGSTLVYQLNVTNAGPSDATNVVLTDSLPGNVTFVSTSGCAEDPNGIPTCTLGSIAAGGAAMVSVTVTASGTGLITNTVTATGDQDDLDGASATDNDTTINVPPLAVNDSFETIGSVALEVAPSSSIANPRVFVSGSVLDNDTDDGVGTVVVTSTGPITGSAGGTGTMNADGSFVFTPSPTAGASETFSYTISDGFAAGPAPGTVNVTISGNIIFVDNSAAGGAQSGSGTSSDPFHDLSDGTFDNGSNDAEDAAQSGDTIVVRVGDSLTTPYGNGFAFTSGVRLLGEPAGLDTGPICCNGNNNQVLIPANPGGDRPVLTDTSVSRPVLLVDTALGGPGPMVDIEIVELSLAGAQPIVVTNNGSQNWSVNVSRVDADSTSGVQPALSAMHVNGGAPVGPRLQLDGLELRSAVTGLQIQGTAADPIVIPAFDGVTVPQAGDGATAGQAGVALRGCRFDSDPATPNFQFVTATQPIVIGTSASPILGPVGLGVTGCDGKLQVGLDIFVDPLLSAGTPLPGLGLGVNNSLLLPPGPGAGLELVLQGVIVDPLNSRISSTNGPSIAVDPLGFSSASGTGIVATGTQISLIDVTPVSGLPLNFTTASSIVNADAGDAFEYLTSSVPVNYFGSITNSGGGFAVEISGAAGGALVFGDGSTAGSGNITGNGSGGVSLSGNTAATPTTFNGVVSLGATTANATGVVINNNSQAQTVAFNNDVTIVTSGGLGFSAVSGGTVNVANSATTSVTSSGAGTPLNLSGVASGVNFDVVTKSSGSNVCVSAVNLTGTTNVSDLSCTTTGQGVNASTGGTLNIDSAGAPNGSFIAAAGNQAISATTTILGVNLASMSGSSAFFSGNNGSAVLGGGGLTGTAGVTFDVSSGSATISYAGTISNTSGDSVRINATTGNVTLSGTITDTGNGITVTNNTSGAPTITFSGTNSSINSGADTPINLDNNDNATITFNGGGLDIDSTTATAFNVVNGAAAVNVTGAGNTIDTTTGRAVNVSSSTIGASGLNFQRISSTVASSNPVIALDSTGSTGGFTVTGDGGNTAGSGGTIDNKTGDAITLSSVGGKVTLENMIIEDIGNFASVLPGHDAIHAENLTGGLRLEGTTIRRITDMAVNGTTFAGGATTTFTGLEIINSTIEDTNRYTSGGTTGDDNNESAVRIRGIDGTVTVTGSTFRRGAELLDFISANTGSLNVTVQSSLFRDSFIGTAAGADGLNCVDIDVEGSTNATITIGDGTESIPVGSAGSGVGNQFYNCALRGLEISHNSSTATGTIDAVVSGNVFENEYILGVGADRTPFTAVDLLSRGTSAAAMNVVFSKNRMEQPGVGGAGIFGGLFIRLDGAPGQTSGTGQFEISDNIFKEPLDTFFHIIAEYNTAGRILINNNQMVGGNVTVPPFGSIPSIFQGPRIQSTIQGAVDVTINNNTFPFPAGGCGLGGRCENLYVETTDATSNLCLSMANNVAADSAGQPGFRLEEDPGTFTLAQGASASFDPATVLVDNGNTGSSTIVGGVGVANVSCGLPSGGIF